MLKTKVTLKSFDGKTFEIDESIALHSNLIKDMIKRNESVHGEILLPNVSSKTLSKVIQYCQKHVKADDDDDLQQMQKQKQKQKQIEEEQEEIVEEELKRWDKQFMKKMYNKKVYDLLMAADYMEIENLIDLTCQTIADRIKDMTVERVRDIFGIENDFTPDEEERIRNKHH